MPEISSPEFGQEEMVISASGGHFPVFGVTGGGVDFNELGNVSIEYFTGSGDRKLGCKELTRW